MRNTEEDVETFVLRTSKPQGEGRTWTLVSSQRQTTIAVNVQQTPRTWPFSCSLTPLPPPPPDPLLLAKS